MPRFQEDPFYGVNQPEVQLRALQLWVGLKVAADTERIAARFRQLFAVADTSAVARAIRLTSELGLEPVENDGRAVLFVTPAASTFISRAFRPPGWMHLSGLRACMWELT
jgi:hypothetical protein